MNAWQEFVDQLSEWSLFDPDNVPQTWSRWLAEVTAGLLIGTLATLAAMLVSLVIGII